MSEWPDEEPISEQEEAYGRAYYEYLAVGELEPDVPQGVDPERAHRIRQVLMDRWRASVRRITRHPGRSPRK